MKAEEGCELPRRSTTGSAAYDFFAPEDIHLVPGQWTEFGTGVSFDGTEKLIMPMREYDPWTIKFSKVRFEVSNWVAVMYPRSGLGFRNMVRFANTTGIIDKDYREEIRCKMTADVDVTIPKGKAYAQMMFVPFLILRDEVVPTEERKGGFGSTDRKEGQE